MADTVQPTLPPADFLFLVESVLMQAQMQLGLIQFGEPDENDPEPNLPLARHSIDLLGVLEEKTKGNLTVEEQRFLENGLTELRFRFVQISNELSSKSAKQDPGSSVISEPEKTIEKPMIITPDGGKGSKTE